MSADMAKPRNTINWQMFLAELEVGLEALACRVETVGASGVPPVVDEPGRAVAAGGEILVGIGSWATKDAMDRFVPMTHAGICLQDNGAPSPSGRRYASMTDFVATAGDELWQDWTAKIGPRTPRAVLERFTLIVEDVSPDSCLGLICFLALVAGVPAAELPHECIDYVGRWEAGDVRSTGEAFASWGCLHSALGHSHIASPADTGNAAGAADPAARNEAFGRAWLACLRFDLAVLRSASPPHDLSGIRPSREHLLASAFLNYEYQQYRQGFLHAMCLQLLLPMSGMGNRYKLVDAYFEEEQIPLGAKKAFLRNDREHTWLRDGFGLMALHKPAEKGSGNDMTVSVDPAAGVHLEDLWREMERMEDEHWGAARPSDRPRLGIKGYPDGRCDDGRHSPNQPWYDDRGRYTLVAAPKRFTSGALGSKLSWRDVRDAAWRLYNPLRFLRVQARDGTRRVCPVEALTGSLRTPPGKRLVIAGWVREALEQQSLLLSPTVKRCLAACACRREGAMGPLSLEELPDEVSFDFLSLPGGFGVVHRDGVFLLDDWRNEKLNETGLRAEFERVSARLATLEAVKHELNPLVDEIDALVGGKRRRSRTEFELLNALSTLKIRIQRGIAETAPLSSDPAVSGFREVLERRWGVARKLEDFHETVAQIETTLRDRSELRTNRIISGLTIYGFPAVLLAQFFQFISAGVPTKLRLLGATWDTKFWGVDWLGLAVYVTLSVAGTVILWLLMQRLRSRR